MTASPPGLFAISSIGSGIAGGGQQSLPPLPLFGGTGITQGFAMAAIPEPTSIAMVALGIGSLWVYRRRN